MTNNNEYIFENTNNPHSLEENEFNFVYSSSDEISERNKYPRNPPDINEYIFENTNNNPQSIEENEFNFVYSNINTLSERNKYPRITPGGHCCQNCGKTYRYSRGQDSLGSEAHDPTIRASCYFLVLEQRFLLRGYLMMNYNPVNVEGLYICLKLPRLRFRRDGSILYRSMVIVSGNIRLMTKIEVVLLAEVIASSGRVEPHRFRLAADRVLSRQLAGRRRAVSCLCRRVEVRASVFVLLIIMGVAAEVITSSDPVEPHSFPAGSGSSPEQSVGRKLRSVSCTSWKGEVRARALVLEFIRGGETTLVDHLTGQDSELAGLSLKSEPIKPLDPRIALTKYEYSRVCDFKMEATLLEERPTAVTQGDIWDGDRQNWSTLVSLKLQNGATAKIRRRPCDYVDNMTNKHWLATGNSYLKCYGEENGNYSPRYACNRCGKVYKWEASLKSHQRLSCKPEAWGSQIRSLMGPGQEMVVTLAHARLASSGPPVYSGMLLMPCRNRDSKPWTGWSVTRGEVISNLIVKDEDIKKPMSPNKSPRSSHMKGSFPCERCGRTYIRKDSLQRHLQWECGKEPTFQCPFCPQKCKRKAHQIRHIRRQHKDMLNAFSDFIGVRTVNNSPRSRALREMGWDAWSAAHPSVPTLLLGNFHRVGPMLTNIGSESPKNFVCPRCDRAYKLKSSLRNHEKGQHSPPPMMSYNTNSNTKARALTSTLQMAQLTERSLQPTVCSGLDPRPAGND
uniref:C2H2-type domain-containing protein n=1 Tax=Timema douglasi TaxID=61478 RepID=A0A7R8Z6I6_TIMDO|nr:unnamed protein product [Timema douglasi]